MMRDQVWACLTNDRKKMDRFGRALSYMCRLGCVFVVLPFLALGVSTVVDGIYYTVHSLAFWFFLLAAICFGLWIWGSIARHNGYTTEKLYRWCPITKMEQLYLLDLTDPEVLKMIGEKPIEEDNYVVRLHALHQRLTDSAFAERLLRSDVVERFGIHVFGVPAGPSGLFCIKCDFWFGLDGEGKDIRQTFRFGENRPDPKAFRDMLQVMYQKTGRVIG